MCRGDNHNDSLENTNTAGVRGGVRDVRYGDK